MFNKKYGMVICLFVSNIVCMQQRDQALKQELVLLNNNLQSLEKELSDEIDRAPCKAVLNVSELVLGIIESFLPPVIENKDQLAQAFQDISNFAQIDRNNKALFDDAGFLNDVKKIVVRKQVSTDLVEDAFNKLKDKRSKIYKPVQNIITNILKDLDLLLLFNRGSKTNQELKVRQLFREGYSPNSVIEGYTLMENAIRATNPPEGIKKKINILLDAGAEINYVTPDLDGKTLKNAVKVAMSADKIWLANYLLELLGEGLFDTSIAYTLSLGNLKSAKAQQDISKLIMLLVQKGVDPKSKITKDLTMLEYAQSIGNQDLVNFLTNQIRI